MVCVKCGNVGNFIVFKGETIHVKNGHISHVEQSQTRAMCSECFSCDVAMDNLVERELKEVAA